MITKLYWTARLFGYVACLVGIFFFLRHQLDADPTLRNAGLGIVGIGFVGFFLSYALRGWLRYAARRNRNEVSTP